MLRKLKGRIACLLIQDLELRRDHWGRPFALINGVRWKSFVEYDSADKRKPKKRN